jgi:hypothetical protein
MWVESWEDGLIVLIECLILAHVHLPCSSFLSNYTRFCCCFCCLLFVLGFFSFFEGLFFIKAWCFLSFYYNSKKVIRMWLKKLHKELKISIKSDAQLYALFPSSVCHLILTLHLSFKLLQSYLPTYLLNVLTYHVRYLLTYAMYPPTQYTYHLPTYLGSQHAIPHISYPCNYLGYRLTYLVTVLTYLPTYLSI